MANFKSTTSILNSVFSGDTLNVYDYASGTDVLNLVFDDTNNALRVNLSGYTGGDTGGSPTYDNVYITNDLWVSGNTYENDQYVINDLYVNTISDNIGTGVTFNDSVIISTGNDLYMDVAQYQYFGDDNTDGSWRFYISGIDMIFQRRVSGTWTTKGTFTGA